MDAQWFDAQSNALLVWFFFNWPTFELQLLVKFLCNQQRGREEAVNWTFFWACQSVWNNTPEFRVDFLAMLMPVEILLLLFLILFVDVVFNRLNLPFWRQAQKHLRGILKPSVSAVLASESLITGSQQHLAGQRDERYRRRAASRWEKSTASAQSPHHSGACAGSRGFCGGEPSQRNTCWILKRARTHARLHTDSLFSLLLFFLFMWGTTKRCKSIPTDIAQRIQMDGERTFLSERKPVNAPSAGVLMEVVDRQRGWDKAAFKRRHVQRRLLLYRCYYNIDFSTAEVFAICGCWRLLTALCWSAQWHWGMDECWWGCDGDVKGTEQISGSNT